MDFLIKPGRKTLLGPNSKKVPVAIAMTEREGSAGRTAPAHYAHFQPAILTALGKRNCSIEGPSITILSLLSNELAKSAV